ncbi:MAG: endonuclease domain-containing protein [Cellulophaga sp.]|nr:endonuclease domain-containing protein [Cellulophaga sp.]
MKKEKVHSRKELAMLRKELRSNLTLAEAFLWNELKARKFESKRFTKQHSIGNYIVDFYCPSEKLIIELDGEVHNNTDAMEYDEKRTEFLEDLGYKVIRFENKMVFENLSSVFKEISDNFIINRG